MVRLPHIQGSSGVIISGSPQVTLCVSQRELSVSPKAWARKGAEERWRRGGKEWKGGKGREEEGRGSPRIYCGAGNHRLNTDRMKERSGKGRERGV